MPTCCTAPAHFAFAQLLHIGTGRRVTMNITSRSSPLLTPSRCLPAASCFHARRPAATHCALPQAGGACRSSTVPARRIQALRQQPEHTPKSRSGMQLVQAHGADGNGFGDQQQRDWTRTATSAGLFLLWAGVLGYVFALSPNQTPFRDQFFLEKLTGINPSSKVDVGKVFFNLFNIMGVYPALYAALLLPAGKSSNKVPAAPFLALSFGAGIFALLPYFALWTPLREGEQALLPKSELGFVRKALESRITAGVLLVASVYLLGSAAFAGNEAWLQYFQLFDESRFVHVTSIDFLLLTAFVPFWLVNDAEFRNSQYKDQAILFALLPVIGPALYLLLRPRSE